MHEFSDQPLNLRLTDLQQLHEGIITQWQNWITRAPPEWKADGFLTSRIPISVSCQYGQDQPLEIDEAQTLRQDFIEDCKFSDLRMFSFALATHIEYVKQNAT